MANARYEKGKPIIYLCLWAMFLLRTHSWPTLITNPRRSIINAPRERQNRQFPFPGVGLEVISNAERFLFYFRLCVSQDAVLLFTNCTKLFNELYPFNSSNF